MIKEFIKLYYEESASSCSTKIDILFSQNFANFIGKQLCLSLFFNENEHRHSCKFWEIFKNPLFTEPLQTTAFDYTFIERKTSMFQTKTLRINASEIMVLIKKIRYLPLFL